jgi:two-component system nitrate/nitrite response regulator NarL
MDAPKCGISKPRRALSSERPVQPISVLLADGHVAYREGLARAIEADPRLNLVAEAADGRHALEELLALEPDLAVLEVRMPQLDGLEVCEVLCGLDGELRTHIVLLSGEVNETLEAAARSIGVAALLSKDSSRNQLCDRFVAIAESLQLED